MAYKNRNSSKDNSNNPLIKQLVDFMAFGLVDDNIEEYVPIDMKLPPKAIEYVNELNGVKKEEKPIWSPNPDHADGRANTQRLAYESKADVIGLSGTAGWGKATCLNNYLATPKGWTTMGEVQVGDTLFDDQGLPCKVIAVSPIMYDHDVYDVVFSDNSVIRADSAHKWLTFSYYDRSQLVHRTPEWREQRRNKRQSVGTGKRPNACKPKGSNDNIKPLPTGNIVTTFEILQTLKTNDKKKALNHAVRVTEPLQLPYIHLPVDPYIIGIWLGDGSSHNGVIATADIEILEHIKPFYEVKAYNQKYVYGINGLSTDLRKANVFKNKHIPMSYLRSSYEQRLELLKGLMDSDGTVTDGGTCEITLTRKVLADDTFELIVSLGFKPVMGIGRAKIGDKDYGEKYRIKFSTSIPVFKLERKYKKQITKERGTQQWRYIVDVRKVESVPVKCVAVDSASHLYLVGKTMIPTHNTDLLIGMAVNKHKKSVILRRIFADLRSAIDRSREIFNGANLNKLQDSYNESLHRWMMDNGRKIIEFQSCLREYDKEKQRGRARDFYAFDEAPQFTRSQFEFITGWNRSPDPDQHCQVALAFNVPPDEAGSWVIDMFMPWIAGMFPDKYSHPNPAKIGELRYFATIDGKEMEFETGDAIDMKGEIVYPRSRTFFFGTLEDNPYMGQAYISQLQSTPEPMRSQLLYGNFATASVNDPWQVIRTEWIREAQLRWLNTEKPTTPLTGIGVDVARGGNDKTVISKKYDNWFDELISYPGAETFDGPIVCQKVSESVLLEDGTIEDPVYINVDSIAVGSSPYDFLRQIFPQTNAVDVREASNYRDKSGKYRMVNKRAEIYWRMRELLDPANGYNACLPPDSALLADLASATYKLTPRGIQIDLKDEIKDRIGRSPDKGEAVLLANYYHQRWFFAE